MSDVPQAASFPNLFTTTIRDTTCKPCTASRTARYLTLSTHDPVSGAINKSIVRLSLFGLLDNDVFNDRGTFGVLEFGDNGAPAGHPVPRSVDGYVAMDRAVGEDANIHSITYPGETQTTVAPAPITTTSPERMPAWSPDGIKLGFVRHSGGQRKLGVFDSHARHPDRSEHPGRDRRGGAVPADAGVPERLRRPLDRERAAERRAGAPVRRDLPRPPGQRRRYAG